MAGVLFSGFEGVASAASLIVPYADGSTNSTLYNLQNVAGNDLILQSSGTGIADQTGVISGSGAVQKTGAGTINLDATNTFSGTFTLTTGTIGIGNNSAFGTSTIIIGGGEIRAVNAAHSVSNALLINNSFTVGRLTTFTGNVSLGANITITANNPDAAANGDSTFNGVISGSGKSVTIAEGPMGIGTGSIVFGGANTYNGGTTVSSGRLTISGTGSLASGSALAVNGGNLVFNNATQTVGAFSGTGGTITLGTGNALTVTPTTTSSYSGVITGAGSLTDAGSGTLTLSGPNTYTGSTTLSGGTLSLGSAGALGTTSIINFNGGTLQYSAANTTDYSSQFASSAGQAFNIDTNGQSVTFASPLVSSGGTLTKLGAGALTLTAANTYDGATTISGGTLLLSGSGTISGENLTLDGGVLATSGTFSLPLGAGAGQVQFTSNGGGFSANGSALTVSGLTGTPVWGSTASFLPNGAPLILNSASATNVVTLTNAFSLGAANQTITVNDNAASTADGAAITGVISGNAGIGFTKNGAGTLTLSAANTFSGPITVSAGTLTATSNAAALGTGTATLVLNGGNLTLANDASLSFSRNTTVSADTTITDDRLTSGPAQTFTLGTLSIGANTLTLALGSHVTTGLGTVTFGAATFTGTPVISIGTNLQVNLGAVSQSGGTYGLTLNGPGTLDITATSSYAGPVTLNGGVFATNVLNAGGINSGLGASSGAASNLILNGGELLYVGGGAVNTDRLFTLSTAGGSIISTGSGALNFINTGSVVLTGTNTARTFTIGGTSGPPNSFAPILADNGTGATSLVKSGSNAWVITGANTYTGGTTVTGGALGLSGAGSISAGNLLLNGGVLAISGSSTPVLGTGAGQVQFGASGGGFAAYGAPLTVTTFGSSVAWGASNPLPDGAPLIFGSSISDNPVSLASNVSMGALARTITVNDNTATAADTATLSGVISGVISGNAGVGLNTGGAGTLILTGANTYTGPTTISGGTLVPTTAASISSANLVLNGGVLATMNGGAMAPTNFALPLGTGAGQVQFGTGGGGLAAYGGPLTITGFTGTPVWGSTASFLPNNAPLILSSINADNVVTWTNDFSLGTAARTITVNDNIASTADAAVISGVISGGTNIGFTKSAAGQLTLGAANTYTGATTIAGGTVVISTIGNVGSLVASSLGEPASIAAGTITLGSTNFATTLRYLGSGSTTDRVINIASGNNNASSTIDSSGTGPLVFTSALTSTSTFSKTLILTGSNTNVNELQGAIPNNSVTNLTSLTKSGAGTWKISGSNTYTGATTVNQGTLVLGSSTALGNSALTVGSNTIGGTAVLDLNGNSAAITSLTIGGTSGGDTTSVSNLIDSVGTGVLTLGGNVTFGNAGNPLGSTISTALNFGTATRTITINDSSTAATDLTISGAIGETSSSGLIKANSGTLLLTGANTYTGPTSVTGGTLVITTLGSVGGGASSLGAPATVQNGTIGLGGTTNSGTLRYLGSGGTTDRVIDLSGTTGGATLDASGTGPIVFTSALTASGAGSKTLTLTGTGANLNELRGAIVNNAVTNLTSLAKTGTGIWEISGANTYTGTTSINQGELILGSSSALANSALTVSSNVAGGNATLELNGFNATVASLTLGGSGSGNTTSVSNVLNSVGNALLTLGGNVTFNNSGNPLGSTISTALSLGAATRTFTVNDSSTAANDLTVSGAIGETSSSGLVKAGAGTLALTGLNTYTGATSIAAGTVAINSLGNVGSASSLGAPSSAANGIIALGTTTSAGTLRYLGSGSTTNRAFDLAGTTGGAILDSSGTGALVFTSATNTASGAGSKTLTLTGADTDPNEIQGAIVDNSVTNLTSLSKTGAGTWKISGVNTYTGATTINQGTLVLGSSSALGNSALTVSSNVAGGVAVLDLGSFNATVASLTIGGSGSGNTSSVSSLIGTGTLTLGAGSGGINFNNGGNPLGSTISSALNLGTATRTFAINDSATAPLDLTVSGAIGETASSGLTKAGSGTLALTGLNTYTGVTFISNGALAFNTIGTVGGGASSLGAPATVQNGTIGLGGTTNAGTLRYLGSGSTTDRVIDLSGTTGGAALDASGTGPIVFTSALTASGAGSKTFLLTGTNTGLNELQGAIVNNSVTNTTALTKAGPGTWKISGANTYTGFTIINQGTLILGASNTLPNNLLAVTSNTAGGTAILDLNGQTATVGSLTIGGLSGGDTASVSNLVDISGGGLLTFGSVSNGITFSATGNPLGSTISANLNMGAATRSFIVGDSTTAPIDLTVSGTISANSTFGFTKAGTGTMLISGTNTYNGPTNINAGTLLLGSATALPSASSLNIYANSTGAVAVLDLNGQTATTAGLNLGANSVGASTTSVANVIDSAGGGKLTLNGGVFYSATNNPLGSTISSNLSLGGANRSFNVSDSTTAPIDLTVSGVISQTATAGITKSGLGTLLLSGTNTYTGPTTISVGKLVVDGSIASSAVTINSTGTLGGSGTVGAVTINSGGTISPGNAAGLPLSPGTLTTGAETWAGGGGYVWELNNATDAGSAKGVTYDWLNSSGTLNLTATSGSKFTIYVTTLTAGNTPGAAPGFVYGTTYQWVLASFTSASSFNAAAFTVDTSGFGNDPANAGNFTITNVGSDVLLNLVYVPEPSTDAAAIGALLGVVILLRRRRSGVRS